MDLDIGENTSPTEALHRLAAYRNDLKLSEDIIKSMRRAMEETETFKVAKAAKDKASESVEALTKYIKEYFRAAPDAGLPEGVKTRNKFVCEVTDQDALLAWAEEHMPAMIVRSVDASLLEAVAKDAVKHKKQLPDGVSAGTVDDITLAQDLSFYL